LSVAVDQLPQSQVAGGTPLAGAGVLSQVVEGAQPQHRHRPDHLLLSDPQAMADVAVTAIVAVATAVARARAFQVDPLDPQARVAVGV
jgi:hypothetical protein